MYPVAASRNRNWARAASFTGAYDATPSIVAAFSSRRTLSSYLGKPWRIRRDSDNDEMWSRFLGNGPHLDTAHTADFLNGANGYILRVADQTGTWIDDDNGTDGYDAVQTAEAARQPLYVASGQNGRPVLRFDGVDDRLFNGSMSITQALTMMVTGVVSASDSDAAALVDSYNNQQCVIYRGRTGDHPGDFVLAAGASSGDQLFWTANTNWNVHTAIGNGASSEYYGNGSLQASGKNPGANGLDGLSIGALRGNPSPVSADYYLQGDIAELIICNAALATADRQGAESAANAYWSIY